MVHWVGVAVGVPEIGVQGTGVPGVGVMAGSGVMVEPLLCPKRTLSTDGPSNVWLFQLLPSLLKRKRIFMLAERHRVRSTQIVCQPCTGLACPNTVPLAGQVAPPSVDTCAVNRSYSLA